MEFDYGDIQDKGQVKYEGDPVFYKKYFFKKYRMTIIAIDLKAAKKIIRKTYEK